jgi:uncharacterized alkaline shock family protein YloU
MIKKNSNRTETKRRPRGRPEIPSPKSATEKIGRVTIAPEVLATIARKAALGVAGVGRMSSLITGSFNRLLKRGPIHQGVRLELKEGTVSLDLYLVAKPNVSLHRLGQKVQREVARAIQELVGMPVQTVNVHIEEIEATQARKASAQRSY